jgi:small subunit ribosomal protein S17
MKRILRGKVVSDKMDKTVVVLVERSKAHPLYRKNFLMSKKYKAQNDENKAKAGDMVEISESRPLSAGKRWVVTKVLTGKEAK